MDGDESYEQKRQKNNEAVRKSRTKSKAQTQNMVENVKKLKTENEELTAKITRVSSEIDRLKKEFFYNAGNLEKLTITPEQIKFLSDDDKDEISPYVKLS